MAGGPICNPREGFGKLDGSTDGNGLSTEHRHHVADCVANGSGRQTKSRVECMPRGDHATSSRVAIVADLPGWCSGDRSARVPRRGVLNVKEKGMFLDLLLAIC